MMRHCPYVGTDTSGQHRGCLAVAEGLSGDRALLRQYPLRGSLPADVLHHFALLSNYSIIVEPHTAKGRLDVMMETRETIYVMEMKFDKSADEALQQINDRKYADSFAHRGKPVVKVGLNFLQKDGVSSLEWKIE